MGRLQVYMSGNWEYVFCRNAHEITPIITKDIGKAMVGDDKSKEYFEGHYPRLKFRIV